MQTQHSFISLIPDANSITILKKQTEIVTVNSGLPNKNINQFFHLTLLDISSDSFNKEQLIKVYKNISSNLSSGVEIKFELIKHNKNKYLYCAILLENSLIKDLRTALKIELQKADPIIKLNNSGQFLPHITLINNINPYQKFLISKQIESNQNSILIKFKEISLYQHSTRHSENLKFGIQITSEK